MERASEGTEGGDFRKQYPSSQTRFKMADSILLEPYYNFRINVNSEYLSKVLYDLETADATFTVEQVDKDLMLVAVVDQLEKCKIIKTGFYR